MRFADAVEATHSKALQSARRGSPIIRDSRLEDEQLAHLVAAALLRTDEEIAAWDAMERGEGPTYVRYTRVDAGGYVVEQVVPGEPMTTVPLDPHVVRHYDPNFDDDRGGYFDHEWHRTRDRAQARCDELNEAVLRRETNYAEMAQKRKEHEFREATVLHAAGMRPKPRPVPAYEPPTVESLISRRKEHYVVTPLEFDP